MITRQHICILRGINVSGQKLIKMAELREELEKQGFQDVLTYIQSGNILFNSASDPEKIPFNIHELILNRFGHKVPVIILQREELIKISEKNPFLSEVEDISKLHVTFLNKTPDKSKITQINADDYEDDFIWNGKEIFLHCPNGYGRTKLNNNFWESRSGVTATTRNWKTVLKLIELSKD